MNHAFSSRPLLIWIPHELRLKKDQEAQKDSVEKTCPWKVIQLRNSIKYGTKHLQMYFPKVWVEILSDQSEVLF